MGKLEVRLMQIGPGHTRGDTIQTVISFSNTMVGQVRPGMLSEFWNRRGKRSNSDCQSSRPRSTIISQVGLLARICSALYADAPSTRTA